MFAYDATAIPKPSSSLASFKSRLVFPFWYQISQVDLLPLVRASLTLYSVLEVTFISIYDTLILTVLHYIKIGLGLGAFAPSHPGHFFAGDGPPPDPFCALA